MGLFFGCNQNEDNEVVGTQYEDEQEGIIYINEEAGWQITLPKSWDGYFRTIRNEDGAIDFYFYGQSEFSRNDLYASPNNGLYFFSIVEVLL